MRTRASLLVTLLVLVAGCTAPGAPGEAREDASCEARHGGPLAPIVASVPALQDDPDVAMMRLAEVVGDPPQGTMGTHGDVLAWPAANGTLLWQREGNASVVVSYEARGPIPDAPRLVESALTSFQQPFELAWSEDRLQARQRIGGADVVGSGARYEDSVLSVGPLVQLDPRVTLRDHVEAAERAIEVAACVDGDASATAASATYALRDDVLVERVRVPTGPEGCAGDVTVDLHAVDLTLAPPIICQAAG